MNNDLFSLESLGSFCEKEPLAVQLISQAWKNNRLSHAYIFTGKDNNKILEFVKAFSKILLCNSKNALDNCQNCKIFQNEQHPDFRIFSPPEDSKFIKLDQIHDLISVSQNKPIISDHKVLVLEQINFLNVFGSNALLKTLEEPKSYVTIILTVDTLDSVLPTIISRCQIIPIRSFESNLEEKNNFDFKNYLPKTYLEANKFASEFFTKETSEIKVFISTLQYALWEYSKSNLKTENILKKQVIFVEKLEEYLKNLDNYVNSKMLMENLFIDLFENKEIFS